MAIMETTTEHIRDNIYKTLMSPIWQMDKVDQCPHRKWNDLVICYRYKIDDERCALITKEIADQLEMTEEDLYQESKTDHVMIQGMFDVLTACGCEYTGGGSENFLVVNPNTMHGASSILNEKEFKEKVKADCYLIPSSIHEWLLLNPAVIDTDSVKEMVKSVNNSEVDPKDRLSYNVYWYDAVNGMITIL